MRQVFDSVASLVSGGPRALHHVTKCYVRGRTFPASRRQPHQVGICARSAAVKNMTALYQCAPASTGCSADDGDSELKCSGALGCVAINCLPPLRQVPRFRLRLWHYSATSPVAERKYNRLATKRRKRRRGKPRTAAVRLPLLFLHSYRLKSSRGGKIFGGSCSAGKLGDICFACCVQGRDHLPSLLSHQITVSVPNLLDQLVGSEQAKTSGDLAGATAML